MSNQLIKNTAQGIEKVFPKTYTEGIVDKSTGKKLDEILSNYNMYFLQEYKIILTPRYLVP